MIRRSLALTAMDRFELRRVLSAADAAWLVAGNMFGVGIFITPGLVAGYLPGAVWALVAWVLGGVLALSGASTYAELGVRIPHAGGDYQYLASAFGHRWGFLFGWSAITLSFSAAAAVMARVATAYVVTAIGVDAQASPLVWYLLPPITVLVLSLVTGADTPAVPRATYLAQNFPNPFNPMTTIEFGLEVPAHASLRGYDAAGRLVRVLLDETLPAGR